MFRIQDILREGEGGEGSNAGGDGGGNPAAVADPPASPDPASGGDRQPEGGSGGDDSRSIFQGDPSGSEPAKPEEGDGKPDITDARPKDDVVTKPFHVGLYAEDGKLNKEAFDRLPDHLKKHKHIFERFDTVEALLHGAGNAFSMAGRKGDLSAYERPSDDAPESVKQQHDQFLKVANGVPDSIEGYGLTKPEGVSDDAWDQSQADRYAEIALKHNAPPELMRELAELNAQAFASSQDEMAKANREYFAGEVEKLKQEHRSAFPEVRAQAERVVNRFGMDDAALSSASNVNALYRIAKSLGEDNLPSHSSDPSAGMTDRQKALDIINNPQNPHHKAYMDPNHPEHDEAVAYRSKLNASWTASRK